MVTVKPPAELTVAAVLLAVVAVAASLRVRVKLSVASGDWPLCAVMVTWEPPRGRAAEVPLSVAVPSPLSTKLTPLGSDAPPSLRLGVGKPRVVTLKLPAVPTVKVVLLALVMDR